MMDTAPRCGLEALRSDRQQQLEGPLGIS